MTLGEARQEGNRLPDQGSPEEFKAVRHITSTLDTTHIGQVGGHQEHFETICCCHLNVNACAMLIHLVALINTI